MKIFTFAIALLGALLFPNASVHAQTALKLAQPTTDVVATPANTTAITRAEFDRSQWDLNESDWERFDDIMRGPRRFWSPNIDPLTVLGTEARDDRERQRYAELLVQQERQRVEQELAFTRAYAAAWKKLYPGEPLIDRERLGLPPVEQPFVMGDRIALFMDVSCVPCANVVGSLAKRLPALAYPGVDLYFMSSDDELIRKWTVDAGIPLELVESGKITLNADEGVLAQLTGSKAPEHPAAFRRRGDEFVPIEVNALLQDDLYATSSPALPAGAQSIIDRLSKYLP